MPDQPWLHLKVLKYISFLSLRNLKAPRGVSPLCKLHRYVRPPRVPPPGTKAANIFIKERGGGGGGGIRAETGYYRKCEMHCVRSRFALRRTPCEGFIFGINLVYTGFSLRLQ